jgi:hypothetical protein
MGALTIRNINDETKQALRLRGALRGSSMEDEARSILSAVIKSQLSLDELSKPRGTAGESAWDCFSALREKYGTFDLEIPERVGNAGRRVVFFD